MSSGKIQLMTVARTTSAQPRLCTVFACARGIGSKSGTGCDPWLKAQMKTRSAPPILPPASAAIASTSST
eukprot:4134005-Lingulodinium_polyedra.AAC.1